MSLLLEMTAVDFNGTANPETRLVLSLSQGAGAAGQREVGWGCLYPRFPQDLWPGSVKDGGELPWGTSQPEWLL